MPKIKKSAKNNISFAYSLRVNLVRFALIIFPSRFTAGAQVTMNIIVWTDYELCHSSCWVANGKQQQEAEWRAEEESEHQTAWTIDWGQTIGELHDKERASVDNDSDAKMIIIW